MFDGLSSGHYWRFTMGREADVLASSLEHESDADLAARVTLQVRLRAVLEVVDGVPVVEVAERYGVARQTITGWRKPI